MGSTNDGQEDGGESYFAYVSKKFQTFEFQDLVGISVSPRFSGNAFTTIYDITVLKPIGEALTCVIGYLSESGDEVIIEDVSPSGTRFSSQR